MNYNIKKWLDEHNFKTIEDNQGLTNFGRATKDNLTRFLHSLYRPGCAFYVLVLEKKLEYEQEAWLNHNIAYAIVAVLSADMNDIVDFFMIDIVPNLIRFNEDMVEAAELIDDYFNLRESIYDESCEGADA